MPETLSHRLAWLVALVLWLGCDASGSGQLSGDRMTTASAELLEGTWSYEPASPELTQAMQRAAHGDEERAIARAQAAELARTKLAFTPSERVVVRDGVEVERQTFSVESISSRTITLRLADRALETYRFEGADRLVLEDGSLEYPLRRGE